MVDPRVACDLCGLELGKNAVVGQQGGLERHFCCPGCARVFEVASQAGMLEQALAAVRPADRTRGQEAVKRDAGPSETMHFSIDGMWCAGCAVVAERILRRQAGVMDAQVSFAAGMGRLQMSLGEPTHWTCCISWTGWDTRRVCSAGPASAGKSDSKNTPCSSCSRRRALACRSW